MSNRHRQIGGGGVRHIIGALRLLDLHGGEQGSQFIGND